MLALHRHRTSSSGVRTRTSARALVAVAAVALALGVATAAPATARPVPVAASHRGTAPAAKAAHDKFRQFRSPSRNIYCHISVFKGGNESRCDVHHHSYHVPPKPQWCHFDWSGSVTLSRKARFACVSDPATESPHVRTLGYGHHLRVGHIKCTSRTTGMTCRNLRTGHGFTVSREAADFF